MNRDHSIVPSTGRWLERRDEQPGGGGQNLLTRPDQIFRPPSELISPEVINRPLISPHTIETLALGVNGMLDSIMRGEEAELRETLGTFRQMLAVPRELPTIKTTTEHDVQRSTLGKFFGRGAEVEKINIVEQKAPYLNITGPSRILPHAEAHAARTYSSGGGEATVGADRAGKFSLSASSRQASFHTSIQQSGPDGGGNLSQSVEGGGAAYAEYAGISVSAGAITYGSHIEMGFK